MMYLKDSGMDFIKQMKNMIFKKTFFVPCGGNKKMNKSRLLPQPSFHFNSSPSFKIETSFSEIRNNWKCLLSDFWLRETQVFPFSASSIPQHCCPLQQTTLSGQYLSVHDGKTQISSQHSRRQLLTIQKLLRQVLILTAIHFSSYYPLTISQELEISFPLKRESLKAPQLSKSHFCDGICFSQSREAASQTLGSVHYTLWLILSCLELHILFFRNNFSSHESGTQEGSLVSMIR